jgi:hypothetical protein
VVLGSLHPKANALEVPMRSYLSCATLGVALVAGAAVAEAQPVETVVAAPPVVAAPVETVETVRTVQTTGVPHHRAVRHTGDRVTTTRTTVSQSIVPASEFGQPLYDVVTPAAAVGMPVVAPAYRYIYEPDRILVIDPYTNTAIQAIPR